MFINVTRFKFTRYFAMLRRVVKGFARKMTPHGVGEHAGSPNTGLLHQLNAALYKVVQRLACEHVVLQQGDVDELLYGAAFFSLKDDSISS